MIDIHSHVIAGLDDGARSEEISRALLRLAYVSGTRSLIVTPHVLESSEKTAWQDIVAGAAKLQEYAEQEALPMKIFPGCELEMNSDLLEIISKDSTDYCLAGSRYILMEFPAMTVPPETEELFYRLQLKDKWPIIAHPERNRTIMRNPERLLQWLRNGVHLQCNAGSFTGYYGIEVQRNAELLLANGIVSFLGSDAHNLERRSTDMREAVAAIEKKAGTLVVATITVSNPQKILDNRVFYLDVPRQLIFPTSAKETQKKQHGFWSSFFR